ncbi:MAG: hypothetical protein JNJ77_13845 [Planctomycetia bacterium]|nr:hypothetical protein [Planctomycetia bacterium]
MSLLFKWIILLLTVSIFAVLYLGISWATTLTPTDIKTCKMLIRIAIDGYAEPLRVKPPEKKSSWHLYPITQE